jgi:hypothetical protein
MSSEKKSAKQVELSPVFFAKIAGALYLLVAILGPISMMYIPGKLIVSGDAATTASNIVASESLFRFGLVSDSLIFLSEIVLIVVLYVLFKPVSKTLSLVAAFSRLAMAVVQGVNILGNCTVLLLLSGAAYLTAFKPDQLQALAMLILNIHSYGVHIWEAFFGLHCLVLGYLLFKSEYFPKVLGILMTFAAIGYFINSFGNLLFPSSKEIFASMVAIGAILGEIPFMFWLLFKGVDKTKWEISTKESI